MFKVNYISFFSISSFLGLSKPLLYIAISSQYLWPKIRSNERGPSDVRL